MNNELTLDNELICRPDRPEGLFSFLVSRSKSAARSLTPSASEVLNGCTDAVKQVLRSLLRREVRQSFVACFTTHFLNMLD
jgi:hypothetical protein